MKKFLKYSAIGFAVGMLIIIFGPLIGGLLFGAAVLAGGYWLYERGNSTAMKLLAAGIMLAGALFTLESIPVLLLIGAPLIAYYIYNNRKKDEPASAFDLFEKEWAKITK